MLESVQNRMPRVVVHDIILHYKGKKIRISNVDLDEYSYIVLLNDVYERALHEVPRNLNYLLHMRCVIPRSSKTMDVNTEEAVFEMSKRHENELVVNVYVDQIDIIPPDDNLVNNNSASIKEDLGIQDNARHVQAETRDEDDIFILSDDESWLYAGNSTKRIAQVLTMKLIRKAVTMHLQIMMRMMKVRLF